MGALQFLNDQLSKHDLEQNFHPILAGDMNLIFDPAVDALGGNPRLQKNSLSFLFQLLSKIDASDIFRIRHPEEKRFTFRRKQANGIIHRRLDYIFLSNTMQEFVNEIDILPSFMSDHSPVFMSLGKSAENNRGKGTWKFNNSLLNDDIFQNSMLEKITEILLTENNQNPQLKWEFLKYEIRKFCIKYAIEKSKNTRSQKLKHETIVKKFESCDENTPEASYEESKKWLEDWYENYTKGLILRSKTDWYEHGEKSTKYFLNLEKQNSIKNTIRNIFIDKNGTESLSTNDNEILDHAKNFYFNLFLRKSDKSLTDCAAFLANLHTPTLSNSSKVFCENHISMNELSESLFSMH